MSVSIGNLIVAALSPADILANLGNIGSAAKGIVAILNEMDDFSDRDKIRLLRKLGRRARKLGRRVDRGKMGQLEERAAIIHYEALLEVILEIAEAFDIPDQV